MAYSIDERRAALAEYRRTGSVVKTVRNLGYPGRWTMQLWIREARTPGVRRARVQRAHLRHYGWECKLDAVQRYLAGHTPDRIAADLGLTTKMSVYSWVQAFRADGEWGLMTSKERRKQVDFPTKASLERSLPHDVAALRSLAAQLMVDKAVLEQELDVIKKDVSVIPGQLNNSALTWIVDALRSHFPLPMLLASARLSPSSFYYQHVAHARPDKHVALRAQIRAIAAEGRYTYGYRRIWWALRHQGTIVSEKVVRAVMKHDHVQVRYPRKKRQYSSYQGELTVAPPNLVQRRFHAIKPSALWLTDITEFSARDGKVYLSVVVDCFDGLIVGSATSRHPTLDLAEQSLTRAWDAYGHLVHEQPLVVHSDRGTHYRSPRWIQLMRGYGASRSMSKKGYTPDNAACEGFFGRMKNEMYYGYTWNHVDELDAAVSNYITFYNDQRIKTSLGGHSINHHRNNKLAQTL